MHIILTHEQADFDAIASLLGAYLLNERAIPLLPNRMNRNVHAFIHLYGMELPFVDRQDLPSEPIEEITLVDTQSMVSIKGASRKTRVHVIDHHPVRADLPPNWSFTSVDSGANTTLFVETLRERDGVFNTIQSTLLLLGIYEDTGSLTYTRTTPRDLRAAAFLLQEGASLQIAADFLNHPLSLQQQELYNRLRNSSETIPVHGHSVVIASGDAKGLDEELSTIAHKLRDWIDPDALFLLVKTRGGIQLIARSTSDHLDVSEVADHFGGGGHSRAAAALIHGRDLDSVRAELINILPRYVRPAITVAQIMSRGPQVLSLDTRADEASRRMQRYGYEGYPVVSQGRVVGLLTRRAVDRAVSHKLNLTAASLMEAGEVTVHPTDSIEYLQRLMIDTGWGQIPVVDPASGQIVGIVTRTDLLKTLTREARLSSFQNLAGRLESALPPARLAFLKIIAEEARELHSALYIVGGFVRDLLLDRPSLDFDLVVEGDAIALARALANRYGGRVTSHSRFGTAKWFIQRPFRLMSGMKTLGEFSNDVEVDMSELPDSIDLISARTEFYTHPTALPTVEQGSIKLDLHRRDFTINTLALRLDGHHYGELHDYWGGLADLRQGLVRCLHSLSFVDDPTRMLRAVRFEQRFNFQIEERTLELIKEATSLIEKVSGDRIRHELDHILDEEKAGHMLVRLDQLNLLAAIHSGLKTDAWIRARISGLADLNPGLEWGLGDAGSQPRKSHRIWNGVPLKRALAYMIWFIRLPDDSARSVLTRLKIPHNLAANVLASTALWRRLPELVGATPSQVVQSLEEVPLLAIYCVYLASDELVQKDLLEMYVREWRMVSPTISGDHLLALGLRPGPEYRQILGALRNAWLDGQISSKEEENLLLNQLITQIARRDER